MQKNKWEIDEARLDIDQKQFLSLLPTDSKVIKGCAGSGKTLLALHKASQIEKTGGSYFIIAYTRALVDFIQAGANALGIPVHKILTEFALTTKAKVAIPSVDYLFIDESQDFSENDIRLFQQIAKKGIFFFGDSAQQMRTTKLDFSGASKEPKPTVNITQIEIITQLKNIQFSVNHRLPQSIAAFAQYFETNGQNIVANCINKGGNQPTIKKCATSQEELTWILDYVNNNSLKDVGILVNTNESAKAVYDACLVYFANNKNANVYIGVRYSIGGSTVDKLDFNRTGNAINILTFDSAKGLQFETVFIPYMDSSFKRTDKAFYVALTRASENLFITFSDTLSSKITNNVPASIYQLK